jgi:hypothetical protein
MKSKFGYSQFFLKMQEKKSGSLFSQNDLKDILEKLDSKDFIDYERSPEIKYIKLKNDYGILCPLIEITEENEQYLRSAYSARTPEELPVLIRFFPAELDLKRVKAEELTVVLYSKHQLLKEGDSPDELFDWNVVTILSEPEKDKTSPMPPITAMRNALGFEHGGNGIQIDREAYMQSVEFWSKYASICKPVN